MHLCESGTGSGIGMDRAGGGTDTNRLGNGGDKC